MKLKFDITIRHPWGALEVVKVRHWDVESAGRFVARTCPNSEVISATHVPYSY